MKKIQVFILIVATFLLFNIVSAVTVVQAPPPTTTEAKPSLFSGLSFMKSPIFWLIMLGILLFLGLLIGFFFLIRWLAKFIKQQNDLFYKLKVERMQMAKIHRRYNSSHWWKVEKNIPIRLVKMENGKPYFSRPIAHHRGDYTTHEGNVIIACNFIGKKVYWFIPEVDVLVIPDRESILLEHRDKETDKKIIDEIKNLPRAKDLVQFNEGEILIYAESFSKVGEFFIPVIRNKDGKVLDLSMPVFSSLKEVALGNYLYGQTSDFGVLAKKSMEINPQVRAIQKVADTNQSVDVQGDNN